MTSASTRAKELFPLETMDDNLASNDHLYDRQAQAKHLQEAFRRRTLEKPRHAEFVLLNGVAGSGKSSLATAFGTHVVQQGGIFMAGKFAHPHSNSNTNNQGVTPLAPLVQAFEQFTDHFWSSSETDETRQNRREIMEAVVGSELGLLLEFVPCLRRIFTLKEEAFGSSCGVDCSERSSASTEPDAASARVTKQRGSKIIMDKQTQLGVVLRRFFRAVCCCASGSSRRNVVLFLDDLQWADPASLELIRALVSPSIDNNQGLMVLGSCRGEEMTMDHALSVFLRDLEGKGTKITEIIVPNLTFDSVAQLIQDMTSLPTDQLQSIATMTFHQTNGNPFFVVQCLRRLEDNRALSVDANAGVWVWREEYAEGMMDTNRANDDNNTDNQHCLAYLVERMKVVLPQDMQQVLMAAACLGAEIRESFLCWALGGGEGGFARGARQEQVRRSLQMGVEQGYWDYDFDIGIGHFTHDRFIEASLELIPQDQIASFQLMLGRNLQLNARDVPGAPKALPTFVRLILCGKTEIASESEKGELASLCLEAARLMAKSSAFAKAVEHVLDGINLLSVNHWEDQYELTLRLYNAAAELAYCNGDHNQVDYFVNQVRENVTHLEDGIQADTTQIFSLGSRGLNERAGALGIHSLRKLGEYVPGKVTRMVANLFLFKARRLLLGKSDEDILSLPKIRNGRALAVMSILHVLYPIVLMTHIEYGGIIACRLVSLTLQHGLCSYSSVGFAMYGSALARIGCVSEGCRFGELSLKIMKKHPAWKELMARTLQRVGLNLKTYQQPFRFGIETLLEANRLGMITGDLETALYATCSVSGLRFWTGDALQQIVDSSRQYIEICNDYGQHHFAILHLPVLQCCLNLMGQASGSPLILTGEAMNEKELLAQARLQHNKGLESLILFLKYILATYLNELACAESLSAQIRQIINLKHPPLVPIMWTYHHFFESLVAVSLATLKKKPSMSRNRELRVANRRLKIIRQAADHCPENMMNKVCMIEADLAACHGRFAKAESKYRQSIVFAAYSGFVSEQALACEKLARMLRDHTDKATEATEYFIQARALYETYGATLLVNRITREIESSAQNVTDRGSVIPKRAVKYPFASGSLVPKLSERDIQIVGLCFA